MDLKENIKIANKNAERAIQFRRAKKKMHKQEFKKRNDISHDSNIVEDVRSGKTSTIVSKREERKPKGDRQIAKHKAYLDGLTLHRRNLYKIKGRASKGPDRQFFSHAPRTNDCLARLGKSYMQVHSLKNDYQKIRSTLAAQPTMEHQILSLRYQTQLTPEEYQNRLKFTQLILTCLQRHHNIIYEGVLFGSTVNGLGFRDSDVDLRLRPLRRLSKKLLEPVDLGDVMREHILRNIAYQTTHCCPTISEFVPSARCPIAKLTFIGGNVYEDIRKINIDALSEGLRYDVSLSTSNPLVTLNSAFLRFLCYLEPKFHLLATVLRYWSSQHGLIRPGKLSSYALVNMLIFFCQKLDPPLLPTIDQMREKYLEKVTKQKNNGCGDKSAITQIEWHCLVCLDKESYSRSSNSEPLSVLLLKFFEFYLNFPYKTHIITTRPGKALTHDEFNRSSQKHPKFPFNAFLNIQDPFDLKHNLTNGMLGGYFRFFMTIIRCSYESLFTELVDHFENPLKESKQENDINSAITNRKGSDPQNWGLNSIFTQF